MTTAKQKQPEPTGFKEEVWVDYDFHYKDGSSSSVTIRPTDSIENMGERTFFHIVLRTNPLVAESIIVYHDALAWYSRRERTVRIPIYEKDVMDALSKAIADMATDGNPHAD